MMCLMCDAHFDLHYTSVFKILFSVRDRNRDTPIDERRVNTQKNQMCSEGWKVSRNKENKLKKKARDMKMTVSRLFASVLRLILFITSLEAEKILEKFLLRLLRFVTTTQTY